MIFPMAGHLLAPVVRFFSLPRVSPRRRFGARGRFSENRDTPDSKQNSFRPSKTG